jgi:hypothetical protein
MAEMAPLQAKDVSTFDSNMNFSKLEENGVKKGRIMCPSHNASTHKTSDCNGCFLDANGASFLAFLEPSLSPFFPANTL